MVPFPASTLTRLMILVWKDINTASTAERLVWAYCRERFRFRTKVRSFFGAQFLDSGEGTEVEQHVFPP